MFFKLILCAIILSASVSSAEDIVKILKEDYFLPQINGGFKILGSPEQTMAWSLNTKLLALAKIFAKLPFLTITPGRILSSELFPNIIEGVIGLVKDFFKLITKTVTGLFVRPLSIFSIIEDGFNFYLDGVKKLLRIAVGAIQSNKKALLEAGGQFDNENQVITKYFVDEIDIMDKAQKILIETGDLKEAVNHFIKGTIENDEFVVNNL